MVFVFTFNILRTISLILYTSCNKELSKSAHYTPILTNVHTQTADPYSFDQYRSEGLVFLSAANPSDRKVSTQKKVHFNVETED